MGSLHLLTMPVGAEEIKARQVYRPDSVRRETRRAIIPLGLALLPGSSHLPACSNEPPFWPESQAHAYLMLLRVEVAAFHPAAPQPVSRPRNTEMAVSVHV